MPTGSVPPLHANLPQSQLSSCSAAGTEEPLGLTPDLQPSTGDTTVMAYQQATDTGTMRSIVVQLSNYFPINLCYYQNQEGFPSRALLICKGAAQLSLLQRETIRILSSKDHILPIPALSPALGDTLQGTGVRSKHEPDEQKLKTQDKSAEDKKIFQNHYGIEAVHLKEKPNYH